MSNTKARAPRQIALLKVKVADGGQSLDVTLADVSATGFMAKAAAMDEVILATRTRRSKKFAETDLSVFLAKDKIEVKSSLTPTHKTRWWHWHARSAHWGLAAAIQLCIGMLAFSGLKEA